MLLDYAMNQIKNLSMVSYQKLKSELNRTLELPNFINTIIELAEDPANKKFQGVNSLYNEPYPRTIRIAPPVTEMFQAMQTISNELQKIDRSNMGAKDIYFAKQSLIRDTIKPVQVLNIKDRPILWWGDTINGINLRPGFVNNDRTKAFPFAVGGTRSHLFAVGDTGEGKSVLMNAQIVALLMEYPPWELNLLLNDGKKQEYAIYAQAYKCPQIRNIAITESATYLETVFRRFDYEMKLLNTIYSRINVKSLGALRDYLDLYIPSNLVIHDEYAQMKANAVSRENILIDKSIQSISKLGRATHYHLYPTSQELRGHIENSSLNQFTIGIAAGTNDDNSKHALGNDGAVELKKKKGYALVNTNRVVGDKKMNVEYKVAFMDDKTDEEKLAFQMMLKRPCDLAKELGVSYPTTVYDELDQILYKEIGVAFNQCKEIEKTAYRIRGEKTLATLTLGSGTRFTGTGDCIEYIRWNYERKGNIMIHAVDVETIKYLLQLVGDNLKLNNLDVSHRMIIDNMETFDDYVSNYRKDTTGDMDIEPAYTAVYKRDLILKFNNMCESDNKNPTYGEFCKFLSKKNFSAEVINVLNSIGYKAIDEIDFNLLWVALDSSNPEDYPYKEHKIYKLLVDNDKSIKEFANVYTDFKQLMSYRNDKYLQAEDLPKFVYWFFEPQLNEGLFGKAGFKDMYIRLLEIGPSVGVFNILVFTDTKDMRPAYSCCKHILTGQVSENLSNSGVVTFVDTTGILCKYTMFGTSGAKDRYFKQFLKL